MYISSPSWLWDCERDSQVALQQANTASCSWYELATLLRAILSSSVTHRFGWVSSLFQRNVCFVIDSTTSKGTLHGAKKNNYETLKQADDHVLTTYRFFLYRVCTYYVYIQCNSCTMCIMQNSHVIITQLRKLVVPPLESDQPSQTS